MKSKVAIGILAIVAVVLGISLMQTKKKAEAQKKSDQAEIQRQSDQIVDTKRKLTEQESVNQKLESDIAGKTQEIQSLSNNLTRTSSDLSRTSEELAGTTAKLKQTEAKAAADARTAADELAKAKGDAATAIAKRDQQINDLESNRDILTKQMETLNVSIQGLEKNIVETQRKLAASEGDRNFLVKELKRLQGEKAELERQMNDLAFLREQVRELRSELSTARRLEWIRRGVLTGEWKKGAQYLTEHTPKPAPGAGKYNLDVEVSSDGSVRVVPPATNSPAQTPQ